MGGVGVAEVEGRPLLEREWIESARRGDASAFEELVRHYQEIAFRTAYLVIGDADEARDAAQDGFVRAHAALGRFREGAEFRPWLLRIVANAARNRRRSASRRADLALRAFHDAVSGDAAPSPEVLLLADERRRELLAAINGLRVDDRLVIALRWFLDLSEEEMAAVLACPRGTVKSRLSRATARLREAIGEASDV
ncbi:MAG TPA: sigma-70 family RNA polymerase sigma factor [Candidatus Limnocylindria bacterium]|jgi:RNA polymerase sigma-70 factor (ECF subfamily)